MPTPIYIIVPSHDREQLAIRTLQSLTGCLFPESYRGTTVIENGSHSEALEAFVADLDSSYRISYRHTPLANKSSAMNAVISELAEDSLIVFFDDDIVIHPFTLLAYASAEKEYPTASYFGGCLLPDYADEPPPYWLRHYLPASVSGWSLGSQSKITYDARFFGCNWAAPQHHLVKVGMFDAAIGPGAQLIGRGEETILQAALSRDTFGVYVPNAIVWHYIPNERCSGEWAIATAFEKNKVQSYLLHKGKSTLLTRIILLRSFVAVLPLVFLMLFTPLISEHKAFWLKYRLRSALGRTQGIRVALAATNAAGLSQTAEP